MGPTLGWRWRENVDSSRRSRTVPFASFIHFFLPLERHLPQKCGLNEQSDIRALLKLFRTTFQFIHRFDFSIFSNSSTLLCYLFVLFKRYFSIQDHFPILQTKIPEKNRRKKKFPNHFEFQLIFLSVWNQIWNSLH